jgi:hypothetical protein
MKTIITIVSLACTISMSAQTTPKTFQKSAFEEISANRYLAGGNLTDYDRVPRQEKLTPAPKGYEPFYLSHYGRHGARWLLGDRDYAGPVMTLSTAKKYGKLTSTGEQALEKLSELQKKSRNRLGDLTPVGEREHHGIGRRMAQNFPEIFKTPNLPIDARSTTVIRSIISMVAECEELAAANPTAQFHNDVSESLKYYMNPSKEGKQRANDMKVWPIQMDLTYKIRHPERLMTVLFNDKQWVSNYIDASQLMGQLYDLAVNMTSHNDDTFIIDLFTDQELYDLWKGNNHYWYLAYANAPQTDHVMPFTHKALLKNMIETADTVTTKQATLRFGHDTIVLPIACLLELDGSNVSVDNLDELDNYFRNYEIIPYAGNVQLVFYRPLKGKKGDILVKALLNEREVTMPTSTDNFPYYKWADVRQYYLDKLAQN